MGFFTFFSFLKNINIKIVILGIILASVLFGTYKIKQTFNEQEQTIVEIVQQKSDLEQEKSQLKADLRIAVGVNEQNKITIKQLAQQKIDDAVHIQNLDKSNKAATVKIESIRKVIQVAKPEDDGPIAKVLAETIRSIQAGRGAIQ